MCSITEVTWLFASCSSKPSRKAVYTTFLLSKCNGALFPEKSGKVATVTTRFRPVMIYMCPSAHVPTRRGASLDTGTTGLCFTYLKSFSLHFHGNLYRVIISSDNYLLSVPAATPPRVWAVD